MHEPRHEPLNSFLPLTSHSAYEPSWEPHVGQISELPEQHIKNQRFPQQLLRRGFLLCRYLRISSVVSSELSPRKHRASGRNRPFLRKEVNMARRLEHLVRHEVRGGLSKPAGAHPRMPCEWDVGHPAHGRQLVPGLAATSVASSHDRHWRPSGVAALETRMRPSQGTCHGLAATGRHSYDLQWQQHASRSARPPVAAGCCQSLSRIIITRPTAHPSCTLICLCNSAGDLRERQPSSWP